MTITHHPEMDPREPHNEDIELFKSLEAGDVVTFFEWPVEPLKVIRREDDDTVGERVRVEAEGDESFLYQVDGNLWHYVDEEEYSGENNPFPVQDLTLIDERK